MGWGVVRGYERDGSNIHQYPSKEKRNRMGHTAHSDNRENSTTLHRRAKFSEELRIGFILAVKKEKKN